jgi:long-chain acyl-CoA synthetase
MLTHGNLVSNMRATSDALDISQNDVALSFLPLSHGFERMVSYVYLFCGVTIVFAESFDTIARDLARVRPTILTGVPRVYETPHAHCRYRADGWWFKGRNLSLGGERGPGAGEGRAPRVRGLVTSLKTAIGDRSCSRPSAKSSGAGFASWHPAARRVDASVMEFHAIGIPIIEGYGLTETSPILTFNPVNALRVGTVGRAIPAVGSGSRTMARSWPAARTSCSATSTNLRRPPMC